MPWQYQHLLSLLPIYLLNVFLLNTQSTTSLPVTTNVANASDIAGLIPFNLTAPSRKPPPPPFPAFENLLSHRVNALNQSGSPHYPLYLLTVSASPFPTFATAAKSFTTLSLCFYSFTSNLILSTHNSPYQPTHWTTLMSSTYHPEHWRFLLSEVAPWSLTDKVSTIRSQLEKLDSTPPSSPISGSPPSSSTSDGSSVSDTVGPYKGLLLTALRPDPWFGISPSGQRTRDQLYWIWESREPNVMVWQGDVDGQPRVLDSRPSPRSDVGGRQSGGAWSELSGILTAARGVSNATNAAEVVEVS